MSQIELRPIDSLVPYARNARTHSPEQIAQIKASLIEFGWTNSILADADGIVAGHGRVLAATELYKHDRQIKFPNGSPIPIGMVPVVDCTGWTPAQRRAYVIADNKLALNADWDDELLAVELAELRDEDFDLSLTGFEAVEIDELLDSLNDGEEQEGRLTDEDEAPEPPSKPVTVLGDIWLLGKHRIMCGDSTSIDAVNVLMAGEKADMVFTDPPYGYRYESNHQDKHDMLANDDKMLDFIPAIYGSMFENSSIYLCGSFQTISHWIEYAKKHFKYKNLIVWQKNNWSMGDLSGAFAGQHELIIFAHKGRIELIGKRDPDIWRFDRQAPDVHPTQKPVELVEYAMSKVKSGVVLDVFGGSGTTLIACEKTNRTARIMEIDQKYCDVIVNRWQNYTGRRATHAVTGEPFQADGGARCDGTIPQQSDDIF